MATLWIELPYAMSARNFLRSGVVQTLAQQHQVVVLSPLSQDPEFQREFKSPDYALEALVFYDKNTLRGLIQQSWDRVVVAPTETRELAYQHQITTHFLKFARLKREQPLLAQAQALAWWVLRTIPGLRPLTEAVNWQLLAHPYYVELHKRYPPDLVIFTHAFEWRSQSLLAHVRQAQIPAIGMVHSWDNLSSKGVIRHGFQRLLVWNEVNRQEALTFYPHYFQAAQVQITGIPQFNHYWPLRGDKSGRTAFLHQLGLDPQRRLISFFLGSRLRYPDQDLAIAQIQAHLGHFDPPAQLLVRLHPGWDSQQLAELKARFNHPHIHFNVPEIADAATPYQRGWTVGSGMVSLVTDLVRHSDVILNTSSTTTLEAAILDIPIVAIAFDRKPLPEALSCRRFLQETHYQPVLASGATRTAFSPQELITQIQSYLNDPTQDQMGRQKLVASLCGPPDGHTTARIVGVIQEILGKST